MQKGVIVHYVQGYLWKSGSCGEHHHELAHGLAG